MILIRKWIEFSKSNAEKMVVRVYAAIEHDADQEIRLIVLEIFFH